MREAIGPDVGIPAPNVPGCRCPRFDSSLDEAEDFPLCPQHKAMLGNLRWSTVALMFIDLEAALYQLREAKP